MNFAKPIAVLVLWCAALAALAQGQNRLQAIQLIQQGDIHVQMLNLEEAEIAYTNAIQHDLEFADAYMKRAALFMRQGRFRESTLDYNAALNINPYSEYIYNERAKVKMLAMDYKGALNDINAAIALNPENRQHIDYRVEDYLALGWYEKALADVETQLEAGPRPGIDYEREGLLHLLMGNKQGCVESTEAA